MRPGSRRHAADRIEAAILGVLARRRPGASICPSEAARVLEPEHWRAQLGAVRTTAAGMARRGEIEIRRKGKVIDPAEMRGVVRLAMAQGGTG